MVMPVWDHNPFQWPEPPYVMWAIIIINFAIYFLQAAGGPATIDQAGRFAGLIPAAFSDGGSNSSKAKHISSTT